MVSSLRACLTDDKFPVRFPISVTRDAGMIRVYIFAQATSNTTEAIIQMVPSSPRPVKLARGNERKEERTQEKRKRILWLDTTGGGQSQTTPTYILDTP
jgi:hypothetical protein